VGNTPHPRRDGNGVGADRDIRRVKLFHCTLAGAREMIAQTFLVAIDQGRE